MSCRTRAWLQTQLGILPVVYTWAEPLTADKVAGTSTDISQYQELQRELSARGTRMAAAAVTAALHAEQTTMNGRREFDTKSEMFTIRVGNWRATASVQHSVDAPRIVAGRQQRTAMKVLPVEVHVYVRDACVQQQGRKGPMDSFVYMFGASGANAEAAAKVSGASVVADPSAVPGATVAAPNDNTNAKHAASIDMPEEAAIDLITSSDSDFDTKPLNDADAITQSQTAPVIAPSSTGPNSPTLPKKRRRRRAGAGD